MVLVFMVPILLGVAPQRSVAAIDRTQEMLPANFSDLADQVRPGVVNIRTVKTLAGGGPVFRHFFGNPFGDRSPFEEFFGPRSGGESAPDFKQQSLGSGFIINKEGLIVTNNHVIDGADEIKVKLADGREYDARVVGRDPNTDLALVKIDGKDADLSPLQIGDSDQLRVGSWVVAVGSPFGLEQTVTAGIVSAKGRVIGAGPYDDFIQTDASINPGNSGGPLLNLEGKVVGINSAIISRGGGNDGIGFAIPVNLAKEVIAQLKENGKVIRGWLGVAIQDVTPELQGYYKTGDRKGALIAQVYEGEPADKAGIQSGDVVIAVNGKEISSSRDLSRSIANSPIGKKIPVTLLRDGKEKVVDVELVQRPDNTQAAVSRNPEGNGKLGLRVAELNPEMAKRLGLPETEEGLVVAGVEPGSKGAEAGIRQGDVIREINHTSVQTIKQLKERVEKAKTGDALELLLKRAGAGLLVVKVTV